MERLLEKLMQIPFLNLQAQYQELRSEIEEAVLRVLGSGWYILGNECETFEEKFKQYLVNGNEGHVIGVNSGTDALKLSLVAAGVAPGDEVITVANTAIPTATAICSIGAKPVFCDVDAETWLIKPDLINACVTSRTKAIIPVHLYGAVCDMDAILSIAKKWNLAVIEDVAQATGAFYKGRPCGTIGDFGAFSFYPSKNLGACGDGGAVFVKSSDKKDILFKLRNYGQSSRYRADLAGGENSRLDEIQAAILSVKLKKMTDWNKKRSMFSSLYKSLIRDSFLPLQVQKEYDDTMSAKHLFVIKTKASVRDRLIQEMQGSGVQTLIHYPHVLYRQPAFCQFSRENPNSESLCESIISLPFHQYLSEEEIVYIVKCIDTFFKK